MTRKIIGYYNEAQKVSDADQLILEIGNNQVACMVKNAASQQLEGLEVFAIEEKNDWSDILHELRSASPILSRAYHDTHCHYNFEEAVVIPQQKFNTAAAEDWLALMYGDSNRHHLKYDNLLHGSIVNAYRIHKSLHELMGRHFVLYKPYHAHTAILNDVLAREQMPVHFMKLQFYSGHIILVLCKNSTLQIVRSFSYLLPEDVLYHVLNTIQQFQIPDAACQLELSGMFDTGSVLYEQLGRIFPHISFDAIQPPAELAAALGSYPAHYFTPFIKLAV